MAATRRSSRAASKALRVEDSQDNASQQSFQQFLQHLSAATPLSASGNTLGSNLRQPAMPMHNVAPPIPQDIIRDFGPSFQLITELPAFAYLSSSTLPGKARPVASSLNLTMNATQAQRPYFLSHYAPQPGHLTVIPRRRSPSPDKLVEAQAQLDALRRTKQEGELAEIKRQIAKL